MSARRLLALSLAAALVLDLARSYFARGESANPTQMLRSDEAIARAIAWPPGSDVAADAPAGERVYAQRCAVCHGPDGKGNGPVAPSLQPRPRDFSRGTFKFKSTRSSEPPRLDDIRRSIREGLAGTSMPAWRGLLSEPEIDAVAEHIRKLGPLERWFYAGDSDAAPTDVFAGADAARGREYYVNLGCPTCHGEQGRGDGASAPDLRDVWKQPVAVRDLTAPWTYRWGNRRETVYHSIAEGLNGTPMPNYAEVTEPEHIADVALYLETIARHPPWEAGDGGTPQPAKERDKSPEVDSAGETQAGDADAEADELIQRGKYLVRTGMCGMCHTPVDEAGIYQMKTHDLAGGMKIEAGAHGIFFAANLTPDNPTGLGGWSAAQIAAAIQTGHSRDRRLSYWAMPWMVYGSLTTEDALAIAAFLKTLPPVRNEIPRPLYYGTLETVARKALYPWPSVEPQRLTYGAGNFGSDDDAGHDRTALQTWLLRGQRIFLLLAVIAWMIERRRSAEEREHGGGSMVLALMVIMIAAAVAFVERYPVIGPMPAGPFVAAFAQAIPPVPEDPSGLQGRGRYLFATSSCAFCHQGDGRGGNQVSWEAFGTVWSTNLTSHDTGLRLWSDDEILRSLRSGLSRDGRQMHWQAMPWDQFSNLREEDLRSLVAYIRNLPAQKQMFSAPTSQRSDCRNYTFWLRASNDLRGCE